jgi:RNA polymerase sigma-70 factor (ECF subfamily)
VRAAQGGDRKALDTLLRRHHDRVYAICRRLTGNHADALDATQEALITIARRLDRYDERAAFSTWAYRVATNACLDELRRRRRRPDPVDPEDLVPGGGRAGGAALHGAADPANAVADRIDIDGALARLPMEFRVVVVLRDVCELGYAEIAEVVGIPIGTVRSRIARGRAALVRDLGNRGGPTRRPTAESKARPELEGDTTDQVR